jgi:hypothetical protein
MTPDDVQEFVRRDWDAVKAAKQRFWVERTRLEGSLSTWRAAQALAAYSRQVCPNAFGARERGADLRDHVRLYERLDRAADAFCRR